MRTTNKLKRYELNYMISPKLALKIKQIYLAGYGTSHEMSFKETFTGDYLLTVNLLETSRYRALQSKLVLAGFLLGVQGNYGKKLGGWSLIKFKGV